MEHSGLLAILSLLGLAMVFQLTAASDATQGQPIYDTDGQELRMENLYHILPAERNMSGLCLYIGTLSPYDCPLLAVMARCSPKGGDAVMVRPAEPSGGSVPRLSSDLLLTFNHTIDTCMMELQWHVADDFGMGQMHVTVGEFIGVPAPAKAVRDKRFRFRAERHGNGYKLMSCYKTPCRDLVLSLYDYERYKGYWWLTVEEDGRQPFVVVFKRCPWPCSPRTMAHAVMPN